MKSLNGPTALATVTVFTSPASTHLFSDLASLKTDSSNGTKFISNSEINFGNFFQFTKSFFTILCSTSFKFSGTSKKPTTDK